MKRKESLKLKVVQRRTEKAKGVTLKNKKKKKETKIYETGKKSQTS